MGTCESRSFEFTLFDEHGIKVSYNREERTLVFNGWYNYIVPMEEFQITLEDFVKELEIPVKDVKHAYTTECFTGQKAGRPKTKVKKKCKYLRVEKLFRNRRGDAKPSYDLVCQWHECGKTFTVRHKGRKFCSPECSKASFTYRAKNGIHLQNRKKKG